MYLVYSVYLGMYLYVHGVRLSRLSMYRFACDI